MATYNNSEIMNFSMELENNLEDISNHNQPPSFMEKSFKHSQVPNENVFGTEYMRLNGQSELNYNGADIHANGGIIPTTSADYSDLELHKYLNFDSTVEQNPSKEDLGTQRNESLDDFFHDFYEIISSEMKTSSPYGQAPPVLTGAGTETVSFNDHSKNYTTADTGGEFNLDLAQFYVNTSESDFLNSILHPADLKIDSSNVMIPQPHSQFDSTYRERLSDDNVEFSVVDHTNESEEVTGHLHENKETSENAQFSQFYVDFKVNGDVTSGCNEDNSIITYINQDALQSVEYINECGQTETVMYLNQQSDVKHADKNMEGVTQYEIVDFDTYQYQIENIESEHQNQIDRSVVEMNVSNGHVQYYGDTLEVGQPRDILSSLLSDKHNNVTLQAKPFRNPKIRPSNDDFYLKFQEIDSNPTNICFSKRPKVKGSRKQKLETINQIEAVEAKRGRPKPNGTMTLQTSNIPETPKLPSKYVRDRKKKMQTRRKRPRKLTWDSESDYDNTENCNDVKLT